MITGSTDWWPDIGETYWRVSGNGMIVSRIWHGNQKDRERHNFGTIFASEKLAIEAREKIKEFLTTLRKT